MIGRWLRAIDVDPHQLRVLLRTYLYMDTRHAGGVVPARASTRRRRIPLAGGLVVMAIGSVLFAVLAARMEDPLLSGTLLLTYAGLNTAMILLIEFTGVVIAPEDYGVLGHRPVSSRTYFFARLGSVLVYVAMLSVALATLPALTIAWWRGVGVWAWFATVAAVIAFNFTITIAVIVIYVGAMSFVAPQRLRSALSNLQLVAASFFYLSYFLMTRALGQSEVLSLRIEDVPWLWANPGSWYAAWITLLRPDPHIGAAAAGALATMATLPLAAGRVSLEYASRLGETQVSAPRPKGERRWRGLPGFRFGEARAVALLIRAQFRYDARFRLAILGMLPLLGFYVLLGLDSGALVDPFTRSVQAGGPMYMAITFLPLTLHGALYATPGWRAAWIFFATPASPSRLVIAAKNFVAMFFLGGFLIVLGTLWSFFFDRVWHAFVHAAVIGMIAHMFLQLTVILSPVLPFSVEPKQAQGSSRLMRVMFLGALVGAFVPMIVPFFYESWIGMALLAMLLTGGTAALEYTLRRRVARSLSGVEFRS